MKKLILVLSLALFIVPVWANESSVFFKAGPSYLLNKTSFDDAESLMSCIGGKITAGTYTNSGKELHLSINVQYASSIKNYSTFVQIPKSVFTSVAIGSKYNTVFFDLIPEIGIKILDFRKTDFNKYLMGQIGLTLQYLTKISKSLNLSVQLPIEYAISINGSSFNCGLSVLFGLGEKR